MVSLHPLALPGQRVGLFGGSFDPPHGGHLHVSRQALARFGLDRVWWLVSPGNPLKPHGPAPLAARVAAARALVRDPRIVVTDIEARLGTRLTADTIAALQARYPGVRFVWLMGSDNMVQFARWQRWREIAARVPIGVLARPGSRLAARTSVAARVLARYRLPESESHRLATAAPPAWALVNLPMHPASSSALRAVREGVPAKVTA
ncbi:nicotinate-nucleotide adenylyltransferase [Paracoccus sp. S-4012]|uniref:nicotinate-nucleotide adenylyltransferase n=1 Tax=Paracoccus sp. S-4012 TaxID=2665648 RepID=UPI0012AFAFB0|nr:nicotinate-nucleotide adenylyltransferase [Paracoccus sp. S-4012]MRX51262.1 nicotinate-nucleotide adenylyltransferase [Paracoccus sp. S-4012]